ncbi:MAG: GtrA family protein [Clostridia bacterium]|nr:GtrA family protein [Clostridia bacterium]
MKITTIISQHKTFILYGIFGFLTTVINFAVYSLCKSAGLSTAFSVIAAWLISVIFAYIFSRTIVFRSSKPVTIPNIFKEFTLFALCRVMSGVLDLAIMLIFADGIGFNHYIVKVASCCVVTVVNFIISKRIFSK